MIGGGSRRSREAPATLPVTCGSEAWPGLAPEVCSGWGRVRWLAHPFTHAFHSQGLTRCWPQSKTDQV